MTDMLIEQRRRSMDGGPEVGRVLPFKMRRMVGPYIFFDRMGSIDLAPGVGSKCRRATAPLTPAPAMS